MFEDILNSLSECHNSRIQQLLNQLAHHETLVTSLKNQVQTLKEENFTEKLINSEMLEKVKELEPFKKLYYETLNNFNNLQHQFVIKQNSWNKFKEKIKTSISKKKSSVQNGLSSQTVANMDTMVNVIKPDYENQDFHDLQDITVIQDIQGNSNVQESLADSFKLKDDTRLHEKENHSEKQWKVGGQEDTKNGMNAVYPVSRLKKGSERSLSVAETMPWAQKQKDLENRPDFAYQDVVRKKNERKRLEASDCPCCKDASGLPNIVEHDGRMVDRIKLVSRHRFVHKDPETPEGYWDLDYNALYSTDEENDTKEGKRKRLDALEAQKKSKIL